MPGKTTQPGAPSPLELFVGFGLLVLVGVSVPVYAAAKLCSLVTGRDLEVAFMETPAIVAGWIMARATEDPLVVTDPDVFGVSDGVVQALALALALVMLVAGVLVWGWVRGSWSGRRRRDREAAQWASLWGLRSLAVRASRRAGRVVLGRGPWRRLLAVERLQSVFVLGPTGSLKTSGLCIPVLLEWQGAAMATSVKPDLMAETIRRRRELGRVWVFNPAGVGGVASDGWDPLAACTSWPRSRELARWLAEAAAGTKKHAASEAEFWDFAGSKLLAPALWAAALTGQSISQVVAWMDDLGEVPSGRDGKRLTNMATEDIRKALGEANALEALRAFNAVADQDDRQRSGTISTAQKILDVFADEAVAEACSRDDIDPEALLDGPNTLYLFAPLHEQDRLRPVFEALLALVVRTAMERSAASGRPLDPPLLIELDEAGNIAPLANLAQVASTGAGQGIQLLSVFQDFAQVRHRYGDQAATVVNNHRAKLILSGLADADSLELVSRLIGDSAELETSRTTGDGRASRTEHVAYRRLAPMGALRRIKPGHGVLVYGHLAPARVRLRRWWKDRALRRLAAGASGVAIDLEEARRGRRPGRRRRAGGDGRVVVLDLARRGRRRA